MTPRLDLAPAVMIAVLLAGCRGENAQKADSARGTLSPVYPSGPAINPNWNAEAGQVIVVSRGADNDSIAVVLPEVTDSVLESVQGDEAPIAGLSFDLFGRQGMIASAVTASAVAHPDTSQDCVGWPLARLRSTQSGWGVGFVSKHATAIPLDSLAGLSSADSSALAVALTQTAASLQIASDPTFRGLPFRVISAYTFRLDSVDVVVANVVRTVNEEANPRVEHLLVLGERLRGATGKYDVSYYSRSAGREESAKATDVLAVVRIGAAKRPVVVVDVANDEGGNLGLLERTAPGKWIATWHSAFTDC